MSSEEDNDDWTSVVKLDSNRKQKKKKEVEKETEISSKDSSSNKDDVIPPKSSPKNTSQKKPFSSNKISKAGATLDTFWSKSSSSDKTVKPTVVDTSKTKRKQKCKFGSSCYRRNPSHLQEYYHPDDEDAAKYEVSDASTSVSTGKRKRSDPEFAETSTGDEQPPQKRTRLTKSNTEKMESSESSIPEATQMELDEDSISGQAEDIEATQLMDAGDMDATIPMEAFDDENEETALDEKEIEKRVELSRSESSYIGLKYVAVYFTVAINQAKS